MYYGRNLEPHFKNEARSWEDVKIIVANLKRLKPTTTHYHLKIVLI